MQTNKLFLKMNIWIPRCRRIYRKPAYRTIMLWLEDSILIENNSAKPLYSRYTQSVQKYCSLCVWFMLQLGRFDFLSPVLIYAIHLFGVSCAFVFIPIYLQKYEYFIVSLNLWWFIFALIPIINAPCKNLYHSADIMCAIQRKSMLVGSLHVMVTGFSCQKIVMENRFLWYLF